MQTKFHVPRSHSFGEKCDDNLKLASHFSPILCNQGTYNIFCILIHMDTLGKPNFKSSSLVAQFLRKFR